jgi:hypothetical protein
MGCSCTEIGSLSQTRSLDQCSPPRGLHLHHHWRSVEQTRRFPRKYRIHSPSGWKYSLPRLQSCRPPHRRLDVPTFGRPRASPRSNSHSTLYRPTDHVDPNYLRSGPIVLVDAGQSVTQYVGLSLVVVDPGFSVYLDIYLLRLLQVETGSTC